MNFNLKQKSKKVMSLNGTLPSMSYESMMQYLFEMKQKMDVLYHMFSMMKPKEEEITEEEDTDEEKPKLEQNERNEFPVNPSTTTNVFNFNPIPFSKKKEEIQMKFNSTELSSRNQMLSTNSFPLLMSKKSMAKKKLPENETKSKFSRNVSFTSQIPNNFTNSYNGSSNFNPFLNPSSLNQHDRMIITSKADGGDVNMFG
jgi:hypothetical protein